MPPEPDPDVLVARFLLRKLRADELGFDEDSGAASDIVALKHLMSCPDTRVRDTSGSGGASDTGAEFAKLSCLAECPHVAGQHLSYGEWGDLAELLNSIEQDDEQSA